MTSQATPSDPTHIDQSRRWLKFYDAEVPPHLDYPRMPLYRLLDETAAKTPEHTCALFFGKKFSYRRLRDDSNAFAAGVRALGVQKGMRVGLMMPNTPQFIVAYYGLLKAGAVIVPLNPLYTESELAFHLNDSGAEILITIPMFLKKAAPLREKTSLKHIIIGRIADSLPFPLNLVQGRKEKKMLDATPDVPFIPFTSLLRKANNFTPAPADPDEMALLIYSGGTTGVAKGIMLSHFNVVALAHQARTWGHLDQTSRVLAVLPLFHGFGMGITMNAVIHGGGTTILLPAFNALDTIKAIQKFRPTFLIGVPTMFVAFNNMSGIEKYDLSSLKGIFVGAAPLNMATKNAFEARTGGRMIEGYGLTETVTACMANPYGGQHKIGSIGLPWPDVDAKIVDLETGADIEPGKMGEIVLKAPTMMLGYYKNPEETQKTIVDGWLHTGDIGYMDEDGYFYITDRKKELIIVGGFNVFPREIDELIYAHPKVKEGAAVGIPDELRGEKIKAYIVLKDGETATASEFVRYFREHLAPYKVPSAVEFRQEVPKTMTGKVLRRALREEEMSKKR